MIIVTGAAGFIGCNLIKGLNQIGITNIIAVDDLTDGHKFTNLVDCKIYDYLDKDDLLKILLSYSQQNQFPKEPTAIFHQGACSNTQEWNGRFMLTNNYEYSKTLLHFCMNNHIQFIYASSAAVYGKNKLFKEQSEYERPLNLYGYSKLLFDQYVRHFLNKVNNQIVGLRYFNVYGMHESHKQAMASVVFHHNQQIKNQGKVKLFDGCHGYKAGEQQRDFVYIDDVVDVNLWFLKHKDQSGIFNVGQGVAETFNKLGRAVINYHGHGEIDYISFPKQLLDCYQSFTKADIAKLRSVGYKKPFTPLNQGVKDYLKQLNQES